MIESDDTETIETVIRQRIIRDLKLSHGLFLGGAYCVQPSRQPIFVEDGGLNINFCNGQRQPIVYTNINDPDSPVNNLNLNYLILQQSDICINFPVAEISYRSNLLESFAKCNKKSSELYELYGHFYARKILVGGRLLIKESNSATQTQIDILKFYLLCAYNNLASYSTEIQLDNLPKIETLNGERLDSHKKLANWMSNLYKKNGIISYNDLIPISNISFQNSSSSQSSFSQNPISQSKTLMEKQPGIASFKEKLSFKEWIGNAARINLVRFIQEFHLLQCLVINNYKIEISKKNAFNFVEVPIVKLSSKFYSEIIKPKTNMEEFLMFNNISSIKNISSFPFINKMVNSDDLSYEDYNFLVKLEKYEIIINEDHIEPSVELEKVIIDALESIKPFEALQNVFDEYGHLFPQKIILGRFFKRNIANDLYDTSDKIDLKSFESLKSYLDKLNISYLLTKKGNIIEENELFDLIQNLNNDYNDLNDLEIIEFDNIIPLYKILEKEQQIEIDNIFNNNKIIMTGIVDLEDLDDNNTIYCKRINVEPSLEDESYQVFGSIITKNNLKSEDFLVTFGLYDFNGFSAMIKPLNTNIINITEYCILWMIIGNPSKSSVFSPKNRGLQVDCIKESITLQQNFHYKINTSHQFQKDTICCLNMYCSTTNYESINIKLVEWTEHYIDFQLADHFNEYLYENSISDDDIGSLTKADIHICILSSDENSLKIDNEEKECHLDLIGYIKETKETKRTVKASHFTKEEDDIILNFMIGNKNLQNSYLTISRLIPQHNAKQIRERWVEHLDPRLYRGPLSAEEKDYICEWVKNGNNIRTLQSDIHKIFGRLRSLNTFKKFLAKPTTFSPNTV